jgi:hypothetical protein
MASETSESADRAEPSRRRRAARRTRPSKARPVIFTAVVTTVLLGTGLGTTAYVKAQSRISAGAASPASPSPSATPSQGYGRAVAVKAPVRAVVDWDKVLGKGLADVEGGTSARYSVAILDTASGQSAVYGSGTFDTASIVKVDILATLLLQAQDAGRHLTTQEKANAKIMIENSDNTAASALWNDIGGASGLNAANQRFGLKETTGGSGLLWGLTQTSAADQLRLLKVVFGKDSVLSAASQSYLQDLMGQVNTSQDWGVPSASTGQFEVKNGWLQRTTTGLWDINSIGRVTSDGHTYLVAVTSNGSTTMNRGVALVEEAAKAAVKAFNKASDDANS